LFAKMMIQDELEQLLSPTIQEMGYELWGCEYLAQGRHALLRIYIDKSDGVGIDDCQRVSRAVSALLDVEDPIPGNYQLEVSSPGIPRPLLSSWHYQRYIGQGVQIKTFKPVQGKRKWSGIIISASDQSLLLDVDNEHQELLFSNIARANLTDERGEQ
jgi:ribosome maturation factor RimP